MVVVVVVGVVGQIGVDYCLRVLWLKILVPSAASRADVRRQDLLTPPLVSLTHPTSPAARVLCLVSLDRTAVANSDADIELTFTLISRN